MTRNRTRKQRKSHVDPVTEELRELLKETPPSPVVEVVTAEYKIQEVPETILDASKLSYLEEVGVVEEVDVVEAPSVIETPLYTDPSLKQLFDLIEEFCK